MRTRIVCSLGVVVALALVAGTAFASSSAWKRYTFLEPPRQLASPAKITAQFPSGWAVDTAKTRATAGASRSATAVDWTVSGQLDERDTTLSNIRKGMLGRVGRTVWGEGTPIYAYVDDAYVTLPMGKVWRLTLALVPRWGDKFPLWYEREYVLDRGIAKNTAGTPKHLFLTFQVMCAAQGCRNHNGQLTAIMRSIRITP